MGTLKATPRTQSSIAISMDEEHWVLLNASPDIRAQVENFFPIQPQRGVRGTGISAVILADSQIDHVLGLLMLREGCPITVYATQMVQEDLSSGLPIFEILKSWNGGLDIKTLGTDETAFAIHEVENIEFTVVPLDGKAPPYSPHRHAPHIGDNIGVYVSNKLNGESLFYAPGLGKISDRVWDYMQRSSCVLVDGTFWREDEMVFSGVGTKLASEMGHLPQSGNGGMLEYLDELPASTRKILVHINNTNPILIEDSPERAELEKRGIEVAFDGMSIDMGEVQLASARLQA